MNHVSLIWAAKKTPQVTPTNCSTMLVTQAYLGNFGMLAESGPLWSPKHLARAKDEVRNSILDLRMASKHPIKLNANISNFNVAPWGMGCSPVFG